MNRCINSRMIFSFVHSWASFGYEFSIGMKNQDGSKSIMEPVVFRDMEPGELVKAPTVNMTKEDAQELMDAMWNAGVRPSNGEGNVGQIGAMREHLEDMRRIVFKGDVNPVLIPKAKEVKL